MEILQQYRSVRLTMGFCAYEYCDDSGAPSLAPYSVGSYKSGELVKVQVWLIVHSGRIEFLTGKDCTKCGDCAGTRAICYVGSKNGRRLPELHRSSRKKLNWHGCTGLLKTALLGIGLRVWIGVIGNRVGVDPDEPNALAGVNE
jgi:hypothetical protein